MLSRFVSGSGGCGSLAGLGREPSLERRLDLDGLLERPPKDMLASRGFRHVGVVVAPAEGRRVGGPDGVPGPAVSAGVNRAWGNRSDSDRRLFQTKIFPPYVLGAGSFGVGLGGTYVNTHTTLQ